MENNGLMRCGDKLVRVLQSEGDRALIIDCGKNTVPKWVDNAYLSGYELCSEEALGELPGIDELDSVSKKTAYERYTLISGILPFVSDKKQRCYVIDKLSEEKNISRQTINHYLWLYLARQNTSALCDKPQSKERKLTQDEKNIRWALNKFYYSRKRNTLTSAYTSMLKEKYCDSSGVLKEHYPSFYQFRYYYRKHRNMQNYYISRDGLKSYQRNNRPLLGDGIQQFAPAVGVGMLDATICDIYLVNDAGGIVGRPILTACIDAYSGLCCGYALSWEGGVYSLRNLLVNIISDKAELCAAYGMDIKPETWNCKALPGTFVTDMGKEYVSDTFTQITDLGITVINLPAYRPELKGAVEKFFDIIQSAYKPYLKGRGVIEPDFQERGAPDYRKDACLTMNDFEKIIIRCILYYNSQRVVDKFPFTEKMLSAHVKPYASDIWNYGMNEPGANLITTTYNALVFTLLPRTPARFTRRGLIVNGMRYKNERYAEKFLTGGTATVAFNPENVSKVWLIEGGAYIPFELIESRYDGLSVTEASEFMDNQRRMVRAEASDGIQAKVALADYISSVAETTSKRSDADIMTIRDNRMLERFETHVDFMR